ncbi:response regulator [Albirhodobacter sp. R86504]|jgi:CheY-like chemotaxis protein|uniref:response regulator n=1 Tax=Albirhodobacter sp. R86504 TaxID=3093848 RepID=UPI00366E237B
MSTDLQAYLSRAQATTNRPLLGVTVLVVEDSRFASEAMRLLCLRSGARIRRADCLRSAHRHLSTYRPGVVIIDMGLPDGCGADLIREIRQHAVAMPVILGTSGDPEGEAMARAAGAHGFLAKPIESLSTFQNVVLAGLPADMRPQGLRLLPDERVEPDPIALRDDLTHAAEVLSDTPTDAALDYISQFLGGVARSAHDTDLARAALALSKRTERSEARELHLLSGLVRERLASGSTF